MAHDDARADSSARSKDLRPATTATFRTKSQWAYEELRRWILMGRLEPGQRLDQERLAAALDVSRMPLRQAVLKLAADGLIINPDHRSAIVAPLSLPDIEDIYASRSALESMLAEVGAGHCDEQLLQQMADSITLQDTLVTAGDMDGYVEVDRKFHLALYHASGYRRACELLERLRDLSDRYIRLYARYRDGASQSIAEHRRILDACRQSDPAEVSRLTHLHVVGGLAVLREVVEQRLSGATAAGATDDHHTMRNSIQTGE